MDSRISPATKPLYRGTQIVWYVLGIIEIILAFRFVLRLLAANAGATFTHMVYSVSYPFYYPFSSVFGATRVEGSVFEWTTLLAMVVYWVIAALIIRLFLISKPVSTPQAAARLDAQE